MPLNIRPWEGPNTPFRAIVPELALGGKWGPPDMSKQLQEGIGSLMDTYDKSRLQAKQESSMDEVARRLEQQQRAGGPLLPTPGITPAHPGYNPADPQGQAAYDAQAKLKPNIDALIKAKVAEYGLDENTANYLRQMAIKESSGDPTARNASGAAGLFQFVPETWKLYGKGGDPLNPVANVDAMARFTLAQRAELTGILGRTPTTAELAIAHQQGVGGFEKLLKNPNAPAVDLVGRNAVTQNKGDPNMTGAQFAQHVAKFYNVGPFGSAPTSPGTVPGGMASTGGAPADLFQAEGLNIRPAFNPGQQFGRTATANAKPFSAIVQHHTAGPDLGSALATARGDPARGGAAYGYHFIIDRDGTIHQAAPLSARTNHVMPGGDINNSNAIGVSLVGSGDATPEQVAAGTQLTQQLQQRYGIPIDRIVGHGEIQKNKQANEGSSILTAFRQNAANFGISPEKLATIGDSPQFMEALRTGRLKPSPNEPNIWTIDGKPVERPDWNEVLRSIPPGARATAQGGPPAAPTAQPGSATTPVVAGAPQKVASGAPGVVTRTPTTEGATASGTNQAPLFQTPQMATATSAASQTPQQPQQLPGQPPPQFQPQQPGQNPQQPPVDLPAQGAQPVQAMAPANAPGGFFIPPGPQGQQPPPQQVRPGPGGNLPIGPPPNAGGPIIADDPALRNPAAGAQGMLMPQGGPGGAMPSPQAQRPPLGGQPAPATAAGGPAGGPGGMPPQLAQMMAQAGVQQPEMSANYAGAMAAAFRSGNPQVVQATANAINTLNQARQKNYQFLTSNGQVYRADPYTGAVEPVAGSGGAAGGVDTILRPGDPLRQKLGIDTADQQDPRLWRLARQSDGSIKPEPISNEPAREDKTFTQEDKLYERVADNPEFKKYRNAAQGLDVLKSNFVEGSPEGDVASVFNFMKALDPTSTVARGEQAMASNASGPLLGLWSYYNNLLGSGSLTPEQRRRFYNTAIEAVKAQEPAAKEVVDEQRRRASAYKLNPDNVYIWKPRDYTRAEKDEKGNEPFRNKEGYNVTPDNAGGAVKDPPAVKPGQAGATRDSAVELPFTQVDGKYKVDVNAIRKSPNLFYRNSKGEVFTGYQLLGEEPPK